MALLELLRCLEPKDYDVSLLVMTGQGELVHQLPSHVKLLNTEYSDLPVLGREGLRHLRRTIWNAIWNKGIIFRRIPYLFCGFLRMLGRRKVQPDKLLWRLVADSAPRQKETYDLAVAYLEGGSTYYVADYVKADKKAAFVHIDYRRAGYDRGLDRDCYLKYNKVFAVSQEVKEGFLKEYPECESYTGIFHNLLNRELICEKAGEEGFTDDYPGIRLVTVGRLTWQKAYDVALDAMRLLRDAGVQARWYILGEGDQRKALEKKRKHLGLQEDFVLLGAKTNPYPYINQADIYIQASRFEGKSIAIQEAQVLGKAILVSDCSGNREQVTDGQDGVLCDLTPESICEHIKELIEKPKLRERYGQMAAGRATGQKEEIAQLLELLS